MKRFCFSAVVLATAVFPSFAHPGHGPGEVPPVHLVTSADHLGVLLAISVAGFCLVNARRWFGRKPKAS
jgi:hydrogenase/urease accessory protein HupE